MGRRFRAIIFDLDDTLYAEADYIVSGYRTVCSILAERGFNVTVDEMFSLFRASRNHVFDRAALQFTFPREWVAELIEAYRSHAPILVLESQIQSVLMLLRQSYKIGILTDGWKNVQQKKIDALKIHQYCDAVIVADEFGYDYWKPNPAIFRICCERLEVSTMETLVVGDNPARDMAGARAAGMACVRIRRSDGYIYSSPGDCQADAEIAALEELPAVLRLLDERDASPNGSASVTSAEIGGV
jgi:putative hydrolase of the HAD superfamily